MAHPQSSPRGNFAKQRIDVGAANITADTTGNLALSAGLTLSDEATDTITQDSTAVLLAAGIALSGQASSNAITQNSTGLLVPDGLALSGEATDFVTQNSTAVAFPSGVTFQNLSAAPATRYAPGTVVSVTNGTGTMLAINTTGTTWTYLNVTSVLA